MRFWPFRRSQPFPVEIVEPPIITQPYSDARRLHALLTLIERYDIGVYVCPDGTIACLKRQGSV